MPDIGLDLPIAASLIPVGFNWVELCLVAYRHKTEGNPHQRVERDRTQKKIKSPFSVVGRLLIVSVFVVNNAVIVTKGVFRGTSWPKSMEGNLKKEEGQVIKPPFGAEQSGSLETCRCFQCFRRVHGACLKRVTGLPGNP